MEAVCANALLQTCTAAAINKLDSSSLTVNQRSLTQFAGLRRVNVSSTARNISFGLGPKTSKVSPVVTAATRNLVNGTVRASTPPFLSNPDQLIDSVEAFVIDIDGVISDGESAIEGVGATIEMLRDAGKKLAFVTNDSTLSRRDYSKKLVELGLIISPEEIYTSSFLAGAYLKSVNFPTWKKVYVIGEKGLVEELGLAGFTTLGGPEDATKSIDLGSGKYLRHDVGVGAVVVGFDRAINYFKLQYSTLCLRENPGCRFVASNRDTVKDLTGAQEWAGAGAMVGAVEGSSQKEPVVVGEPSPFLIEFLASKFGISKSQICVIGDQLETDILCGQNGGAKTVLVLSGVTTLEEVEDYDNKIKPDFCANQLSDLLQGKLGAASKVAVPVRSSSPRPRAASRARAGRGRGRFLPRSSTATVSAAVEVSSTPPSFSSSYSPPTPEISYESSSDEEPETEYVPSSTVRSTGSVRGKGGLRGRGRGRAVAASRSVRPSTSSLSPSSSFAPPKAVETTQSFDPSSFVYEPEEVTQVRNPSKSSSSSEKGSRGKSVGPKGRGRAVRLLTGPSSSPVSISAKKSTPGSSVLRGPRGARRTNGAKSFAGSR